MLAKSLYKLKKTEIITKSDEDKLIDRLNRIAGQIKGIIRMIEEKRGCLQIMEQVLAVRSGLTSVGVKILTKESCKLEFNKKSKQFEDILTQLIKLK
jgi:DNA-binding FrmR family transcriptional regulator